MRKLATLRFDNNMDQDQKAKIFITICGCICIILVGLIFAFLIGESLPFLTREGVSSIFSDRWIPVSFNKEVYGLYPLLCGSLLVTLIACAFAMPLGFAAALYLAEFASDLEREFLKPSLEILASIPSVVLGFFGLVVIVPGVQKLFNLQSGLNALSGGIILAIAALPTMITIAEEALRSVPHSYREASLALGASRLQTVFLTIIPAGRSGIVAAFLLGVGRVIGETMAVLMVTGNAAILTFNPGESVRTMTATIAAEMGEVAFGSTHYHALFFVGLVLLFITFFINSISQWVLRKEGIQP